MLGVRFAISVTFSDQRARSLVELEQFDINTEIMFYKIMTT